MNGSSFSRAIRPQEAKDDARPDLQCEIINGFDCATGAGKVLGANDCLRHGIQLGSEAAGQLFYNGLTDAERGGGCG
jgi:hypothetical protein